MFIFRPVYGSRAQYKARDPSAVFTCPIRPLNTHVVYGSRKQIEVDYVIDQVVIRRCKCFCHVCSRVNGRTRMFPPILILMNKAIFFCWLTNHEHSRCSRTYVREPENMSFDYVCIYISIINM